MKNILAGFFTFSIIALSSLKSTAQDIRLPFVQKPKSISGMQNNYLGRGNTISVNADSTKAIEIWRQDDCSIYALPLDGTRCIVANESTYRMPNACNQADANFFKNTIPNSMEVKDIIPQKTPILPPLTK